MFHASGLRHLALIVDGGLKLITFVVDGKLNDGGDFRQFGFGRFNPQYRGPQGADTLRITGEVQALRTSEAIGNYNPGAG